MFRPLAITAAVASLALAGCGDAQSDAEKRIDAALSGDRRAIEAAVEDGRLPPVSAQIINPDATIDVNFVDEGTYDQDIVHTRDRGNRGPKLAWDFNRDGRIDSDERNITERELYEKTLAVTHP
jgi:hypothetical protein